MKAKPKAKTSSKAEPTISRRALAAELKVSHTAINAWVASGDVPTLPNGKLERKAALKAGRACMARLESGDDTRGVMARLRRELLVARRDRERLGNKAREYELAVRSGELIAVAEVKRQVEAMYVEVRAQLITIGSRTSTQIEALIAANANKAVRASLIQVAIDDEINAILAQLHDAKAATTGGKK